MEEAKSTREVFRNILFKLARDSASFGCPLPCHRTTYNLDVSYFHENTLDEKVKEDETNFTIYLYPGSPHVEERIETLVYDSAGLLTSAGGNLGLMLGFSCLSVFFALINWIKYKLL
jgi:hypothetical protein